MVQGPLDTQGTRYGVRSIFQPITFRSLTDHHRVFTGLLQRASLEASCDAVIAGGGLVFQAPFL